MLSVIVPGIRPHNWKRLLDSIGDEHETIFIGPYAPLADIQGRNFKYISDMGSPARAMNIGLQNATGDRIIWAADDGYFLQNLTDVLNIVNTNDIMTSMYTEGAGTSMDNTDYYYIGNSISTANLHNVDPKWFILNLGIVSKEILLSVGGWDGELYETPFASHIDLAIRLQQIGYRFQVYNKPLFHCDHMPGTSGDHAPIHHGHYADMDKLQKRYSDTFTPRIDVENWKKAAEIWTRRFV